MRILLVEDDSALGEGIRTALKPEVTPSTGCRMAPAPCTR